MATTVKVDALPAVTGLQINDVLVVDRGGSFTKGASFTQIQDANGNELFKFTAVASAINEITNSNNSTGLDPILSATGDDTNIGLTLLSKGTGAISLKSANTTSPLRIMSGTGLQHTSIFSFTDSANSRTITFPDENFTVAGATTAGSSGQLLQSTGGGGIHQWTTATYPTTSSTQYKILQSDGTNFVSATVTGSGAPVCATSPTLTTPRIDNIYDTNGNVAMGILATASAVNYPIAVNNIAGQTPGFNAAGPAADINFAFTTKGAGKFALISAAPTNSVVIYNGTGYQHTTDFVFSNTAANRTVTFPDADGTMTLLGNTSTGSGNVVLATSPTITTPRIAQINDANGVAALTLTTTASAVNYVNIVPQSTGLQPQIIAAGESNVPLGIYSKGSGTIYLASTTLANYFNFSPAATGNNPSIALIGDANQSLSLLGNGTGGVILQGTGTNDSAAAGKVGEFITSNIPVASAGSCTNATARNVTSISLTAGDWDVRGNIMFVPAATTNITWLRAWISTTSATMPAVDLFNGWSNQGEVPQSIGLGVLAPVVRLSLSSTTTVYLSCNQAFTVSTLTSCGTISARRVR